VKLVVLPEYFLTGFPMGESCAEWRDKAAIDPGGHEYDQLAGLASKASIFLGGNVYETDANFPELFFQCCFVINPSGDTVLRYRRLISLNTPSPYDVWDKYLDVYGAEAIFPVADTDIGRIAAIASEEILYPEIARCHAVRGAEVFIHPTSEVGSPLLTPKDIAKRARAVENLAYVVSANTAGLTEITFPEKSSTGMSKIVDYTGKVLSEAAPGGNSMAANSTIDLAALRATRRRTGLTNTLVRHPFEAYLEPFKQAPFKSPNGLIDDAGQVRAPDRGELHARQQQDIDRLVEARILR
jgi:predicted amidohydrolase